MNPQIICTMSKQLPLLIDNPTVHQMLVFRCDCMTRAFPASQLQQLQNCRWKNDFQFKTEHQNDSLTSNSCQFRESNCKKVYIWLVQYPHSKILPKNSILIGKKNSKLESYEIFYYHLIEWPTTNKTQYHQFLNNCPLK